MKSSLFSLLAFVSLAVGHGLLAEIKGANGVTGAGFGVDASTPRDGSAAVPFEQDTSIIRDREIASGKAGACGRTKEAGSLDVAAEMAKAVAAGVPTAAADGTVSMTLHQVNQDGAGPYTVEVDPTGTGNSFQPMEVTQQVPGRDLPGIGSISKAKATDFPLAAKLPAGIQCTGGGPGKGVCLIRARNTAIGGPFGSCAAIAPAAAAGGGAASAAGAANNSTAAAGANNAAGGAASAAQNQVGAGAGAGTGAGAAAASQAARRALPREAWKRRRAMH
ncbi:hypothetical protein JCM8097_004794 [Rhodosporidiobolus ruineniae]